MTTIPSRSGSAGIERQMAAADFWTNQEKAQSVVMELKGLKAVLKPLSEAGRAVGRPADDDRNGRRRRRVLPRKCPASLQRLEKQVEDLELKALLSGPMDANDAIMTINARDGGTDANDWAEMLLRMYLHWARDHEYQVELLDRQDNEQAGINSAAHR